MKGYLILLVITVLLLAVLPPLISEPAPPEAATSTTTAVTDADRLVVKADGGTVAMDRDTFLLYATMHLLPPDAPDEAIKAVAAAQGALASYQLTQDGAVTLVGNDPASYAAEYWRETWGEDVYGSHAPRFEKAVLSVASSSITYSGEPIMAVVHTMNNGKTESAAVLWETEIPYLCSVDSPHDAIDPKRLTTKRMTVEDATDVLTPLLGKTVLPPCEQWFRDPVTSAVGTIKEVHFGDAVLSGEAIRDAFSLPSAVFRACVQEGQVIFTVQGSGHFVGMSLCGCIGSANDGASWQDIIAHYYPGVTVT